MSTPRSNNAAPNVAAPSNVLIIPEGMAAAIDSAQFGSAVSVVF
jgi:hypothetical protein